MEDFNLYSRSLIEWDKAKILVNSLDIHIKFMREALKEAMVAYKKDEVPVGSIVVMNNQIIGRGHNQVIARNSVIAHAEILAMNSASNLLGNYRLKGATLYSTLEPCHMCAKAIVDARIDKVFFAAAEPKTGALISVDSFFEQPHLNHKVEFVSSVLEQESSTLLKKFFRIRRY